ncbi:MAG: class I SAM-dependent methyltransferase [Anaerolineae bacterium]|nr:class I SAM-dependent methyltransferase [Anaerolineae bacterium]
MNKEIYDDFSRDYDRFVNWPARLAVEMPFIEKQFRLAEEQLQRKPKVLDTACGSGMHAIALAGLGAIACGSDISLKMVEIARENAHSAKVRAKFLVSAFGNLARDFQAEPEFPFDLILCLGNSLPHALSEQALREALQDFADCLQPGGRIIIQNRNFDAVIENRNRWMEPQNHIEGTQEWVFLRFYDFDSDSLITFNILRLQRSGTEAWQQRISSTRLFPLKQALMADLLRENGFSDICFFGALSDEPFNAAVSGNLVITARKR